MSDNLATRSLGISRLSLWEKRQQYEAWLASGRRIPKPELLITPPDRVRIDDLEPKKEHKPSEVSTLNDLSLGAVVRTDDEPDDDQKEISDDLRLDFAKALLPKIEGSDAAIAERLVNAAAAMLGPMVRADQEVKGAPISANSTEQPLPPSKPGSSPLNRRSDEGGEEKPRKAQDDNEEEKKEPTLAEVMAALDGLNKRLDNIEAKRNDNGEEEEDDSGSEDIPSRSAPRGPGEGTPKELAADNDYYDKLRRKSLRVRMSKDKEGRAAFNSMHTDVLIFPYQAMADKHYAMLGSSAPKPMYGELRDNYRRRLLTPLQRFSPTFKDADLRVAQVDPVAFDAIEKDIYKCAADAMRNPATVPLGHLREMVEIRGGHTYTKFVGRPISWMNQFAPTGKRVRRIIERSDSGGNRTLYERN